MALRKLVIQLDHTHSDMGRAVNPPARKMTVAAVIANPCAGRDEEDLSVLVDLGAEVGQALPGLRALSFNLVQGEGSAEFDGVPEIWFDSPADFDAAYATDHGRAVTADSLAHVARCECMRLAEHLLVPKPT